jgi:hypothetical protein
MDDGLRDELKAQAIRESRSESAIVRRAVRRELDTCLAQRRLEAARHSRETHLRQVGS